MNGKSTEITLNPVITAGAYSANDVAGSLLVFSLPDAFPVSGIIRSIRVVDDDNEKAAFKLHLFNAKPTLFADNAAFSPVVEDLKKRIGDGFLPPPLPCGSLCRHKRRPQCYNCSGNFPVL